MTTKNNLTKKICISPGLCLSLYCNQLIIHIMANLEKHIWEGWRVIDFINELEPSFNQIINGQSWQKPFKDKQELKTWCMDNQPYYKKYIPEVVTYFWNKIPK